MSTNGKNFWRVEKKEEIIDLFMVAGKPLATAVGQANALSYRRNVAKADAAGIWKGNDGLAYEDAFSRAIAANLNNISPLIKT